MINILKDFDLKKSDKKIHAKLSVPKCLNTLILYTTNIHF